MDMVATYAASKSWTIRPNIVLVEGTSDEALFALANRLSMQSGTKLLGDEICVVAAGRRDRGGTYGVARELITLRSMIPLVLDRHGWPAYRVMGLVDNDYAGRRIIKDLLRLDRGTAEYRDIVAVRPVTPAFVQMDPHGRQAECDLANLPHRDLDWEIEDALSPRLLRVFEQRHANLAPRKVHQGGKTHHEFTADGKTAFLRLAQQEAKFADLAGVVAIVRMIRSMFGLAAPTDSSREC